MKLKSELYKSEQYEICDKIIDILQLDNDKSITLYELDNDKVKQQKILDLIPDIRKYFSFGSIVGASEPEHTKRPWLSIIRHITKIKYQLIYGDYTKKINDTRIRTKRYIFLLK
jgi:hypothetical protein